MTSVSDGGTRDGHYDSSDLLTPLAACPGRRDGGGGGGAAYYFTHPQRVVAELPPDLAGTAQDVHLTAQDGARLHAIWLPGRAGPRADARPHHRARPRFQRQRRVWCWRARPSSSRGVPLPHLPKRPRWRRRAALRLAAGARRRWHVATTSCWWTPGRTGNRAARGIPRADCQMSDLMGWTKWLREEHGQLWVGLWGHSFGAAVGLAWRPGRPAAASMRWCSTARRSRRRASIPALLQRPLYWASNRCCGNYRTRSCSRGCSSARLDADPADPRRDGSRRCRRGTATRIRPDPGRGRA